ncbi:MAG TPA: hypothetical protein VGH28_14425 [Polyangiaceae bacterium]
MRLERLRPDGPVTFRRGRTAPRAIAWFGFSAFWGHMRHLLASAIATDNVDSRQWMTPESPADLLVRAIGVLTPRGAKENAPTLTASLGGEIWIDFVADTGDDVSVSEAVAKLVFQDYETGDPDDPSRDLSLPRGHVLFLGGDLAYPVATVREITRRLIAPWNRVLEACADETPRLLLAVPGNHDWYDGLDGFARLCQAPCDFETPAPRSELLHPQTSAFPVLAWAEAFTRGVTVRKPGALALYGYFPVQRTSYFRLPLARSVELWAVDRQLKNIDRRQREYFRASEAQTPLVVLPDPARAWGETRPHGMASLRSIGVDPKSQRTYVLAGDVHHYERSREGDSVHVIAGGGGAFLHGARIVKNAAYEILAEFPGPKASWSMLKHLPLHVAVGGAGFLLMSLFAIMQAAGLLARATHHYGGLFGVASVETALVAVGTALLVGWRRHRKHRVLPFAVGIGVFVAAMPLAVAMLLDRAGVHALHAIGGGRGSGIFPLLAAWALATFLSGAGFGFMLLLIARFGLNHAQPFAALGLPTHKHFARIRVRETEDETVIDTFVIGQADPLGDSPRELVDHFRWTSSRGLVP